MRRRRKTGAVLLLVLLVGLDLWCSQVEALAPASLRADHPQSGHDTPPAIRLQMFEDLLADPVNLRILREEATPEVRQALQEMSRHLHGAMWSQIRILERLDSDQAEHLIRGAQDVERQPLVQGMPIERLAAEGRAAFPVPGAVPPPDWRLQDDVPTLERAALRFEAVADDPEENPRYWRGLVALRPREFLFSALQVRAELSSEQLRTLSPVLRSLTEETLAYETMVAETDALLMRVLPRLNRPVGRHAPIEWDRYLELVEAQVR